MADRVRSVASIFVFSAFLPLVAGGPAIAGPNWSGFYSGIHGGGAWGSVSVTDTTGGVDPGPFTYSPSGAFGGFTSGLNWQTGALLMGVEGDLGFMNLNGATMIPSSTTPPYHQDLTLGAGIYGDATARLGVVFGQTLLYGKGGFAFYSGVAKQTTTKPGFFTTGTGVFTGWALGAGVERNVTANLNVKLEYLHFDFGTQGGAQTSITDDPVGYVYENTTSVKADTVKVGVEWHYN